MSKLPVVSGAEVIKALMKFGYYIREEKAAMSICVIQREDHSLFPIIKKLREVR